MAEVWTHEMLEGFYVAAGLRHLVPGLRSPGASMQDALRSTPAASRRRAWQDLAEAGGRIPGSHPVRRRTPVGEPRDSSPSPDSRPEKVRKSPTIAASSPPDSASHPVQASLGVDGFGSETPILHFEPPDPGSHPVRRRKSGENVAIGASAGRSEGLTSVKSVREASGYLTLQDGQGRRSESASK